MMLKICNYCEPWNSLVNWFTRKRVRKVNYVGALWEQTHFTVNRYPSHILYTDKLWLFVPSCLLSKFWFTDCTSGRACPNRDGAWRRCLGKCDTIIAFKGAAPLLLPLSCSLFLDKTWWMTRQIASGLSIKKRELLAQSILKQNKMSSKQVSL